MATSCYDSSDCIYRSPRCPIDFPTDPNLSAVSFLFRNIDSYPDRLALIDADHPSQSFTFRQLRSVVASFAAALARLGVKKGDVVLILAPNSIYFPLTFLSILSLGAVATTVNPLYTIPELSKQARDSGAELVITSPALLDRVSPLSLPIILLGSPSFFDMIRTPSSEFRAPAIRQTDVAALLYSSGTTGTSKGVVLTHRNFMATGLMLSSDQDAKNDPANTFLCFLPMFHIFGLADISYAQLLRGNSLVVMERFEMDNMLRCIERYRVTHLFLVPPVMIGLAKQGKVAEYDVSSLRWICSGAAPLAGDLMEEVARNFAKIEVIQGYGLTESCGIISLEFPQGEERVYGSAGFLTSGIEGKVISVETFKPLPPNQQGELLFRGPNIMQGYFNNPQATKSTLDDQGWLHTGDLGYFDEKGQLYVVDRIKELIKCNGFQVAPAELEGVLTSHPGILDAAVVPLEDDKAGQVPIAFVVPRNSSLTEVDVQNFVASQVAPFKRLRRVIFENSIPKTASGKILRRELTEKAKTLRRDLTEKVRSKL